MVQAAGEWFRQHMDRANEQIHESVHGPYFTTQECNDTIQCETEGWKEPQEFFDKIHVAAAAFDSPNPLMILMAAVSNVADKTDFKVALKRDPPMDLVEFYHKAERYLCQEDAEVDKEEINTKDGVGPSEVGSGKDNGKGIMDDGFEESKQQRRKPKFSSYMDLNKTPKRIYLDTEDRSPIKNQQRKSQQTMIGRPKNIYFISWMDITQMAAHTCAICSRNT